MSKVTFTPLRAACLVAGLTLSASSALAAAPEADVPQFNRDIRPILTENCLACHGADKNKIKGELRLDQRAVAVKKEAIVPGQSAKSKLIERLLTTDPEEVMPPPETHKSLKPEQIALLKKWIDAGAPYERHWSFEPPKRAPMPAVTNAAWVKNPVDSFILARLEKEGLSPAPEADRRTLARRLSLDLTGLTPEPATVEAFVNDTAPGAYERLVDSLLATPQWGEHRGRAWLDAARYADTHGLHFDNYREMWPYRDWVINAFNRNEPFDRFTIEQLAGDLLPGASEEQKIATGFHRCNVTTNEGGTIVEENLANYARDRVETTSWVWMGLTSNCAVCHDHKFDPITQKDVYSLSAFFRNTTQPGLDGNVKDSTPSLIVPQGADVPRWTSLPGEIASAKQSLEERKKAATPEFEKWAAAARPADLDKDVSEDQLIARVPLNDGAGMEVAATCGGPMKFRATGNVVWKPTGKTGPAPVLNPGSTFDLGNVADFEKNQPFSYGAWVNAAGANAYSGIIARMDDKNDYRGWDLFQHERNFAVHIVNKWPTDAWKVLTTKNPVKPGTWQHVFVTYDGSGKAGGVKIYLDGQPAETKIENNSLTGTIRSAATLKLGQRQNGQFFENGSLQDARVYGRRLSGDEVKAIYQTGPLREMLAAAAEKRTPEQRQALLTHYLATMDAPWQQLSATAQRLEAERTAIQARSPVTHIQQEKTDTKPMANILFRGEYDQPREAVEPATYGFLPPMPPGAPKNRLGLAQWIVSAENPLPARVTVNRFWQEIFGTGIVRTSEDLGMSGDQPVNPELLDWLAVEFREGGWDVKKFFKLLVTSATYRQQALATPDKLFKDPQNRLLSRGPRYRMDAEMVRDSALAGSGLLVKKLGGPSVKPLQPDGVWEAVAMPESNTRNYKADTGEALHRRSLYTFWKRSAPPASLEIFNAPSREASCLRRERTNTPLQALATLNDPQFIEAARVLAASAMQAAADPAGRLDFIARRILSRPLQPEETAVATASHAEMAAYYQGHAPDAAALLKVGETPPPPGLAPADLAAWTLTASQFMNLDEALNK